VSARRSTVALLLAAWAAGAGVVFALAPVPPLREAATDQTGTLSAGQRQELEQRLRAFEAEKGSQVAVLIVPTTEPEAIEQYSIRVVEAWKLGRGKVDDGALLLVAKNDRALRIEVGYGLEGALPDAIAKRIIEETITPRFKQGDFFGGISAGLDQIMGVIRGEPLPPPPARRSGGPAGPNPDLLFLMLFLLLGLGGILRSVLGRVGGATVAAVLVAVAGWFIFHMLIVAGAAAVVAFVIILLGKSTGGRGGGFTGGFYGGGRSSGFGGSSGGFSGGGGGFGGGGASGRW
jgi:uncharacterized protein